MRILWFTNTPSCYKTQKGGYNGGGWISSLEKEITKNHDIELAICFHSEDKEPKKIVQNNVTYYPINTKSYIVRIIQKTIGSNKYSERYKVNEYLKVINDFKPDIINIFGSEESFGLISLHTNIPIILHIQGIITPTLTAYYPPKYSLYSILLNSLNPIKILKVYKNIKEWNYKARREQLMLTHIRYIMGRTEWDKRLTRIYAPQAKYFHCNEILRDLFYDKIYSYTPPKKLNITSTISSPYYKGFDTILQAAYILKNVLKIDFIWNVYGINDIKSYEQKFKIKASECNIKIGGIIDAKLLAETIKESTVFVHPSYIDNSPNSVCEAQILGCPVIATNVGGIPSLIKDEITGCLIPTNDPYQMAYLIKKIATDKELAEKLSINGHKMATERHNKVTITDNLISIYKKICNNDK